MEARSEGTPIWLRSHPRESNDDTSLSQMLCRGKGVGDPEIVDWKSRYDHYLVQPWWPSGIRAAPEWEGVENT